MEQKGKARLLGEKVVVSANREAETPVALLNDVVLQNIFKYLGFKDLKSCRAVGNTVWLRNSKNAWWSQTKVGLWTGDVEEYFNQTEINSCAKNYKLKYFSIDDYKGFSEHFGHSIKYLELTDCTFNTVDEFCQTICTKFPHLEKLVTRPIHVKRESTFDVEPMKWRSPQFGEHKNLKSLKISFKLFNPHFSWPQVLFHFPNLEALETFTNVDVFKIISVIRQHDSKMLTLKHIDIQGAAQVDHEDSLRLVLLDPRLSFETIRIRYPVSRPETTSNILNVHAESLRELSLVDNISNNPIRISTRKLLLNLEKLTLKGFQFTADTFRCIPNVRKVHLNYHAVHDSFKSTDSSFRIDTCKELSISNLAQCEDSPHADLQFFLSTFPNVETIDITNLNNQKFSMICERWTQLVSFTVHSGSHVDVCGLLGFDPDSKIKTARNPNITNLKGLQTFSMDSRQFRVDKYQAKRRMEMKNAAVIYKELEKLPELKKFELRHCELKEEQEWKKIFAKYPGDK